MISKAFKQREEAYSIRSFTYYAEQFQQKYHFKFAKKGQTKEAQLENQYWNLVNGVGLVEKQKEEVQDEKERLKDEKEREKYKVTIEYAADLPVEKYGSGFPIYETSKSKDEHFEYSKSLFNLNNIYKSEGSILKISDHNNQKISGITTPWVYMGMRFSSFCWHVEDLWLNSLNYSHKGAIKTWYIIPQSHKQKFDEYVIKKTGKRQFLNNINYMIDPTELIKQGIKVNKAYQRPGQYILTFYKAYHAGFSQGFNVGEAVNVATPKSYHFINQALAYGEKQNQKIKPPVICTDWLVYENLKEKYNKQVKKVILKQYLNLVENQKKLITKIVKNFTIKSIEQIPQNTKYDKHSCSVCRYYKYISLLVCFDCQKRFCLSHIKSCCKERYIFKTRKVDKQRKHVLEMILAKSK